MQQDSKNLILAMALSLVVIVGWNHFFGAPKNQQLRQTQSQTEQLNPASQSTATGNPAEQAAAGQSGAAGQPGGSPLAPPTQINRADALAESPRIVVDTKSLFGTIALKGARLDDIALKKYRETTDPKSPNIVLLSPSGAPDAYFIDLNYIAPQGVTLDLPKSDTLWKADGQRLTETTPVTLTYDNGKGLVFKRKISVDDFYMFTVADTVENKGKEPVTLFPDASSTRQGLPKTSGYAVLHEGFIGVIGADQPSSEMTYPAIAKEPGNSKVLPADKFAQGGWLGFTDKYWATAIIPDQNESYKGWFREFPGLQPQYQADVFAEAKTIAPGASLDMSTRVFAGAKESKVLEHYQNDLGVKKFDMLIDWGWFHFITRPMFWLLEEIYKLVGNFGVVHRDHDLDRQGAFLSAGQQVLPVHGQDERVAAQAQGAAGEISRRQGPPAAGSHGALQAGEDQSRLRLPARGPANSGVLLALQGAVRRHRNAAGALLRLDQGSGRARSDQCLQPVRAAADRPDPVAGVWPLPASRRMAAHHGRVHVGADEDEPRARRSGAEDHVRLDAGDLHLHAGLLPGRVW